jgi:hypothetical protein
MKSWMWSTCFIAMFLFAPVALGEIMYSDDSWGCGSPGGATPSAFANGYSPGTMEDGGGSMSYWTTEDLQDGHCYYEVYAYAEAHIRFADGESCAAAAVASASADGPDGSISASASANVSGSGYDGGDDDYGPEDYDSGQADGHMWAWTSTSSSHSAAAGAGVQYLSGETAWAHGCEHAWCSLSGS